MEEQRIAHDTEMVAAVNAPAALTLYDDAGRALTVAAADEGVWLARGFRRRPLDAAGSLKELPPLWKAAFEALKAAVADADDAGALDTAGEAAYHAARVALVGLETGIAAVLDGLHALPTAEPDAVALAHPDLGALAVDPNQVEGYRAAGWAAAAV